LTNLLALSSNAFSGTFDYLSHSWKPALCAIVLVIAAAAILTLYHAQASTYRDDHASTATSANYQHRRLLIICAVVVGVLMPVLATPIPYWLSSTIAAIIVLLACISRYRDLVPIFVFVWYVHIVVLWLYS